MAEPPTSSRPTFSFRRGNLPELEAFARNPALDFEGVIVVADEQGAEKTIAVGVDPTQPFAIHSGGKGLHRPAGHFPDSETDESKQRT